MVGSRILNPKSKDLYVGITKSFFQTLSTGNPAYWPSDAYKVSDLLDFFVYGGISDQLLDINSSDDLSSDPHLLLWTSIVAFNTMAPGKSCCQEWPT